MSSGQLGEADRPPRASFGARLALRCLARESEREALLGELCESWELRVGRDGRTDADRWYRRQMRRLVVPLAREWLRHRLAGPGRGGARGRSPWLFDLAADVRQSARGWARSPVMAAVILATVGLGLGASTAMFAVVRAVLLEPLPYPESGSLVRIYHAIQQNRWNLSVADYQAIEEQQTHFESVAAYTSSEQTLTTLDGAERVRVRSVTADMFDVLGVRAHIGRTFGPGEDDYGAARVALVSWGFWQRALGADGVAIGRTIRLNGDDYTVLGVLPQRAAPPLEGFDVFPALQMAPPSRKGPFFLTVVGRLEADVDSRAAASELRAINRRIFPVWQATFQDSTSTWGMMPLDEYFTGSFRTPLYVLLASVALVLLVASTNAAGLLTARLTQRRQELAARAALGASRSRILRLLVTDALLPGMIGAAFGLLIARTALSVVRAAAGGVLPRISGAEIDGPVLGFAAIVVLASTSIFGLLPAIQGLRRGDGLAETLRAGGRSLTGAASSQRVRRLLVAAQFTIAVPLLAGAALLLGSFVNLQRVDPGIDRDHVVSVSISRLPGSSDQGDFWRQLVARTSSIPGVVTAGLASDRPPCCVNDINNIDPADRPTPPGQSEPLAEWVVASPGYFDALGIGLVTGRTFDDRDGSDQPNLAVVVDRRLVDHLFPDGSPIGRRFYEGGCRSPDCAIPEIVGVVEPVRYQGLDDRRGGNAAGTVYVPIAQWGASSAYLFVRANTDPAALLTAIRSVVHDLDPEVTVTQVATADELVAEVLSAPRNITAFVAGFALIALTLAVIGIYGVMNFFVQEHRRDIGIRLALGGRPASVLALIMRRGLQSVVIGVAVGLAAALFGTRFLQGLLFEVSPHDPVVMTAVVATMLLTAAAACALPAWKASRVDPIETLRVE